MKQNLIFMTLAAAALLLSPLQSFAAGNDTDITQGTANKAKAAPKNVGGGTAHKASASVKLVDINGATREQLKTLQGIGDAEADKIIAGRPYATKAHLVTQNVLSIGVYENLKKRIIAKQPYKDAAKNAAVYNKKK